MLVVLIARPIVTITFFEQNTSRLRSLMYLEMVIACFGAYKGIALVFRRFERLSRFLIRYSKQQWLQEAYRALTFLDISIENHAKQIGTPGHWVSFFDAFICGNVIPSFGHNNGNSRTKPGESS